MNIRSHWFVACTSWVAKIITASAQLISIRLLVEALGITSYSIIALLVGLQSWFFLADWGLGASAQNYISEKRAKKENPAQITQTSRLIALVQILVVVSLLYISSQSISEKLMVGYDQISTKDRQLIFFVATSLISVCGLSGIVYKIWYAEQRGYIANLVTALVSILGLLGIYFVSQANLENKLILCVLAYFGPAAFLPLSVLLWQTSKNFKLDDLYGSEKIHDILNLFIRGTGFFGFAFLAAVTLNVDYYIISQVLSPYDITVYSLATKVFGLIFFVYTAVLTALWPRLTELIVNNDTKDVLKIIIKHIGYGACFVCLSGGVFLLSKGVVVETLAPGQDINIPSEFIVLLTLYHIVRVWSDSFAVVLQSMSRMKPFLLVLPIQAVISSTLQLFLAPLYGLNGILLGMLVSFLSTVCWALPWLVRRYMVY